MIILEMSKRTMAICQFVFKVAVMSSVGGILIYCSFFLIDLITGKV